MYKLGIIKLYKVDDGDILFICSCNRLGTVKSSELSKHTRCANCTLINEYIKLKKLAPTDSELRELFLKLKSNGFGSVEV